MSSTRAASPRSPKVNKNPSHKYRFDPTFALLIVFAVVVIAVMYYMFMADNIKLTTQITSVTTPVNIHGTRGIITTFAQTAAAAGEVVFTVNNSSVKAGSLVLASLEYASDRAGYPTLHIADVAAGSFKVILRNAHVADALNGVARIHFRAN